MKSLPDSSSHLRAVARATAIAAVVVVGVVAAWMVLPLLPDLHICEAKRRHPFATGPASSRHSTHTAETTPSRSMHRLSGNRFRPANRPMGRASCTTESDWTQVHSYRVDSDCVCYEGER